MDNGVAATFHASFYVAVVLSIIFHQDLARLCLHFMKKSLDNINGSDRHHTFGTIANRKKIGCCMSSAIACACIFWASQIETNDGIDGIRGFLDPSSAPLVLMLRWLDIKVEVLQKMKECKHVSCLVWFWDSYLPIDNSQPFLIRWCI